METVNLDDKYKNSVYFVRKSEKLCVNRKFIIIIIETKKHVMINNLYNGLVIYCGQLVAAFGSAISAHRHAEFTELKNVTFDFNEDISFNVLCNIEMFKKFHFIDYWPGDSIEITGPGVCVDYNKENSVHAKEVIFDFHIPVVNFDTLIKSRIKIRKILPSDKAQIRRFPYQCKFIQ